MTRNFLMFVALAGTLAFAQQANQQPAATQPPKAETAAAAKTEAKTEAKTDAKTEAKTDAAKPATADTAKKAEAAKPETKPAAAPADTTKKKIRGKMTYQDYQAKVRQEADSILSVNYHHGISIAGARLDDKSYGDLVRDADWGGSLGIYYFYRYYFSNIAFQGRAGIIYRYANFKDDEDVKHGQLTSGHIYDLNQHMQLSYNNFAFDMPLTVKFGGHVEPTTFLYLSLTFGITKSLYENMESKYTLSIKPTSKDIEKDLEVLAKEGKAIYPLEESHEIEKPFFMDDWETNGWVGVGIDGKYVSIECQALVAAGSTKDNHRYYRIFQKDSPSFRVMIDFSLR